MRSLFTIFAIGLIVAPEIFAQTAGAAADAEKANQFLKSGKPSEAIPIFTKLLHDYPANPDLLLNLCIAEFEAKRYSAAADHARAVLKLKPDMAAAHLFLGSSEMALDHAAAAIQPLTTALQAMPDDANASLLLSEALLATKQYQEALKQFQRSAELLPGNPRISYGLARVYDAQGRYRDAALEWREALSKSPKDLNIQSGLVWALYRGHDYDAALPVLAGILKEKPDSAEANFLYGATLLNLAQPQAAIPYLKTATQRDPALHPAQAALGQALLQAGNPQAAIPYLKNALVDDQDGNTHFQLFRAYQLTGNKALAREAFAAYQQFRSLLDK